MIKPKEVLVSILDITGLDVKWPVTISILVFGFLVIDIIGFFHPYEEYTKILLSSIIPSSVFIPILFLIYIQGYYWKLPEPKSKTDVGLMIGAGIVGGLIGGLIVWAALKK